MIRAKETAEIIHNRFPDLKMQQCDLLCEGAPFPPEPASANWKPEHRVRPQSMPITIYRVQVNNCHNFFHIKKVAI